MRTHQYDPDYGRYTGHPMDPRTDTEAADELREQATDALVETPEYFVEWLSLRVNPRRVHEVNRVPRDPLDMALWCERADVTALVALLVQPDPAGALAAIRELVARFLAESDAEIEWIERDIVRECAADAPYADAE